MTAVTPTNNEIPVRCPKCQHYLGGLRPSGEGVLFYAGFNTGATVLSCHCPVCEYRYDYSQPKRSWDSLWTAHCKKLADYQTKKPALT